MSYIFDALQKSEAERSGVDREALAAATEVLQVAERQAAEEREAALKKATGRVSEAVGNGQAKQQPLGETASVTDFETEAAAEEPIETDAQIEQFGQFQSLRVMVSPQSHLVSVTDKDSLAAEKFRFLAVRLRQMRQVRNLKKVLITSSVPQEGKSTVAANVACALGRRVRQRTLLIDGDLRRPSLSNLFSLGKIPGLCEWLQGDSGPAQSIFHLEDVGIWILPAGSTPRNPLELMQSGKLSVLLAQLSAWFDWIIIDSPPVLPLADTSVWARLADGVVLVTRQGTSEKRQLQRGLEVIERTKLIGALLNSSSNAAHNHYYYHYKSQPEAVPEGREK